VKRLNKHLCVQNATWTIMRAFKHDKTQHNNTHICPMATNTTSIMIAMCLES